MGLAGLRLGLLAGPSAWLAEFDKVRLPYNINVLTQKSAEFAISHREVLDQQTQQICADREKLLLDLGAIKGITTFPSRANFILFRVNKEGVTPDEKKDARGLFDALKARGVLIKNLSTVGGVLQNCLRVTVGSPEQNQAFLSALKDELA
jgi:histidinol-phosphate aminotransferase